MERITSIEALLGGLLIVTLATSLAGIVLVEVGAFDGRVLAGVAAGVALAIVLRAGGPRSRSSGSPEPPGRPAWLAFGGVGLLAVLLFQPPAPAYVLGGDASAYLGISGLIRASGGVGRADPALAALPDDAVAGVLAPGVPGTVVAFPGAASTTADGRLIPEFFHLTPVWMAAFDAWFGSGAAPYVNVAFGVLAVLTVWVVTRRLTSVWGATVAAGLLTLSFGEIWFARWPTSEMAAQYFALSSLASLLVADRTGRLDAWLLAGVSAGVATLARIDAFLIVAAPLGAAVTLRLLIHRTASDPARLALAAGAVTVACSLGHALAFAPGYVSRVVETYAGSRLWRGGSIYLGLLVAAGAVLVWGVWRSGVGGRWVGRLALGGGLMLGAVWLVLAGPRVAASPFLALVSPAGFVLALAGLVLLLSGERAVRHAAVPLLFVCSALLFLPRVHDDTPWPVLLRRYVPVLLPLTSVLIGVALARLRQPGWRGWLAFGLAGVLAVVWVRQSPVVLIGIPYAGTRQAVNRIADAIPATALTVVDAAAPNHLALALHATFGRPALLVGRPSAGAAIDVLARDVARRGQSLHVVVRSDVDRPRTLRRDDFGAREVRPIAAVPLVVPVFDEARRAVTDAAYEIGVYEVTDPRPVTLPVAIDVGSLDFGALLDGWHGIERDGDRAWRWSDGAGRLRLPAVTLPPGASLEIALRLAAWRPDGIAPPRLVVRLAGTVLEPFIVSNAGFGDYAVELPADVAARLRDATDLTLESGVFVPFDVGTSGDVRQLGVAVDRVVLRRR